MTQKTRPVFPPGNYWGTNRHGRHVHYFVNGSSLCGRSKTKWVRFVIDEHDESAKETCQICRNLKRWVRQTK